VFPRQTGWHRYCSLFRGLGGFTPAPKTGTRREVKVNEDMKAITVIITAFVLAFGTVASRAANVDRISAETGVPVATLQAERTSTGLGWGGLETANLLAKASGKSFSDIVAMHKAGEGWGEIARDNGLNLGKLESAAHRSSNSTLHAQNTQSVHGKSTTAFGKGHAKTMNGVGDDGFSFAGFHGLGSMGHGVGGSFHGFGGSFHGFGGHGHIGHIGH